MHYAYDRLRALTMKCFGPSHPPDRVASMAPRVTQIVTDALAHHWRGWKRKLPWVNSFVVWKNHV